MAPSTLQTPYLWAEQLLGLANTALASTTEGDIGRAFVAAGLPALDCCPQLTVHIAGHSVLPTSITGGPLTPGHKRTTGIVRNVRFAITVVRCAPVPGVKGKPPEPATQAAIAAIVSEDVYAIIDAIGKADYSGAVASGGCGEFYFDGASTLDPAGGCVGSVINYRSSLPGLPVSP